MIDTIQIKLNDFEVIKNKLEVKPATIKYDSDIEQGEKKGEYSLFCFNDEIFKGNRAYINTDKWNLSVKGFGNEGVLPFVSLSIPKFHNGNNVYSVGSGGSRAVLKELEKELFEHGIKTNINNSSISRVDLFKGVQTEESFLNYSPVFKNMEVTRKATRDYGTTFLFHNGQEEFCIYDKKEEARIKKQDVKIQGNLLRFEHRLLKSAKIKNTFGTNNVNEFLNNYKDVKLISLKQWEKQIFKHSPEEIKILTGNQLRQEMELYKNRGNKRWLHNYLLARGAYSLINEIPIDVIVEVIKELDDSSNNREKARRIKKELQNSYWDYENLRNKEVKTIVDLYQELKTKLLKVA